MMQCSFKNALKLYLSRAEVAMGKETKQLHSQDTFAPQDAVLLTTQQKQTTLDSIITMKEKRAKSLKGRFCADGWKQ